MPDPVIELCVDSGAYSAFTQKKVVNLDEYCAFLTKNEKYITHSVCLDVIDPEGPEIAAAKGWRNFEYMRDKGIVSMPVFHAREHYRWLDKMLDAVGYIGLSGTSLVSPSEHMAWYRLVWEYATDTKGFPIAKFHAFGDTSPYSLLTFPWYSADSATWMIQSARAARVKLQGKSYQLRSTSIKDTSYLSLDDPAPKKEAWFADIRALGLDPEAVMSVTARPTEMAMIRSYLVAADLLNLQEQTRNSTYYKAPVSLISKKKMLDGGVEREGPVNIFFVISPAAWNFNFPIIALLGIKRILVSYYYLDISPEAFWEERMIPFLCDPMGYCQSNDKVKSFWDKLQEVLYKPVVV
jgi:hypothetical protein